MDSDEVRTKLKRVISGELQAARNAASDDDADTARRRIDEAIDKLKRVVRMLG